MSFSKDIHSEVEMSMIGWDRKERCIRAVQPNITRPNGPRLILMSTS